MEIIKEINNFSPTPPCFKDTDQEPTGPGIRGWKLTVTS